MLDMPDKQPMIIRPLVFVSSCVFAIVATSFLNPALSRTVGPDVVPDPLILKPGSGSGHSGGNERAQSRFTGFPYDHTEPVKLISKPKAIYSELARRNNVQGKVRLSVVLLASGTIGAITPIVTLPDGLTERAVEAARKIKFEPKVVDGRPISVIMTIDYEFSIY